MKIEGTYLDEEECYRNMNVSRAAFRMWRYRGWWPEPDMVIGCMLFWKQESFEEAFRAVTPKSRVLRLRKKEQEDTGEF